MRKLIIGVPDSLHEALHARKNETGVPVSEFIRRTLERALAREAKPEVEMRHAESAKNLVAAAKVLLPVRNAEAE